jgi:hypothetical protein
MMALRIARICHACGVSRSTACTIAALAYGEGHE